jgi:hypothetical protein
MSPNVKTGRRLSGSLQGHDWRRIAVGTFTWRGKTTPIAIRTHQDGLLLQRLYFANEVYNATEIDQGAEPKIRDQERTLAERLISELSETTFHPEKYEDDSAAGDATNPQQVTGLRERPCDTESPKLFQGSCFSGTCS